MRTKTWLKWRNIQGRMTKNTKFALEPYSNRFFDLEETCSDVHIVNNKKLNFSPFSTIFCPQKILPIPYLDRPWNIVWIFKKIELNLDKNDIIFMDFYAKTPKNGQKDQKQLFFSGWNISSRYPKRRARNKLFAEYLRQSLDHFHIPQISYL